MQTQEQNKSLSRTQEVLFPVASTTPISFPPHIPPRARPMPETPSWHTSALKMEVLCPFETLMTTYKNTRRCNSDDQKEKGRQEQVPIQ